MTKCYKLFSVAQYAIKRDSLMKNNLYVIGIFAAFDLVSGQECWKIYLDDRIEATAASADQLCYVLIGTFGGILYCIHTDTGKIQWEYKECQDIIKTKPAVYKNQVVFACHDGFVRCLNLTNGNLVWKKGINAPCAANVIITADGKLPFCHSRFDSSDLLHCWNFEI